MSKRIEINNKTREELTAMLLEQRNKYGQLRFEHADKKVKDTTQFDKIKKDIARILTRLHQDSDGQAALNK